MLRLEARPAPSKLFTWASPLLSLLITIVVAALLFAALGKSPAKGLAVFLLEPFNGLRSITEVGLKATPLILCALGLALCYRSNVWNIGAEGQFLLGGICAGGLALWFTTEGVAIGRWAFLPLAVVAGALGGAAWAAIVAWLRDSFNASEILVSLMLVYVANLLLSWLVFGPWKDPNGFNFPQTVSFAADTNLPRLISGMRVHAGFVLSLLAALGMWAVMQRSFIGYQLQVGGLAPAAARYAGFSSRRALWVALLASGGLAGVAGAFEVTGPMGQLTPHVSTGYGFTAIIVAFVGRLHPLGCVAGSVLLSVFLIGGELAQSRVGLPSALTGVFQGVLLFSLLACDTLINYRIKWGNTMNEIASLIAATLAAGTPLAIAGLGLLVNEKVGVLNLGAEGMMLVAAVTGFAVTATTGNVWLGFVAGAVAGALLAALFGVLVIWLNTNQYATGLALSLFGGGFSAFVGTDFVGRKLGEPVAHKLPLLGDIPFIGPALFQQHPVVYLTVVLTVLMGWFFFRTRAGLVLRAVGEAPESAHGLGYPVRRLRLLAVMAGGALCGVAGAYLSTIYTPLWVEGMVAGRGWIALALTVFATWRPARVLLGAYLFGGITMLQLHLQGQGVQVPSQFMSMLPYLGTVLVLVLISRNPQWIRLNMPASLGKPFFPGS